MTILSSLLVSILSSKTGWEIGWFNDGGVVFEVVVVGAISFVSVLTLLKFGFVNCTREECALM